MGTQFQLLSQPARVDATQMDIETDPFDTNTAAGIRRIEVS